MFLLPVLCLTASYRISEVSWKKEDKSRHLCNMLSSPPPRRTIHGEKSLTWNFINFVRSVNFHFRLLRSICWSDNLRLKFWQRHQVKFGKNPYIFGEYILKSGSSFIWKFEIIQFISHRNDKGYKLQTETECIQM